MDRRRDIDDTAGWRQRYMLMMTLRVGGLLIALLGLLLMRGGIILDEEMPVLGAVLVILGLLDAFVSPKILKRWFDKADRRP